jgi:5-methylcytosine-specific restriction protein A
MSESGNLQSKPSQRNPDWTWDEQVLAFDLYIRRGLLGGNDQDVIELSQLLRSLSIHDQASRTPTFRNPNGVARKLSDIHTHQPGYEGRRTSGSKLDIEVWERFGADPSEATQAAQLVSSLQGQVSVPEDDEQDIEEAQHEGRLLYRSHRTRERSPKLRKRKIAQVYRDKGFLACESCDIRLALRFGEVGDFLYECHHLLPLHISGPTKTSVNQLALLCPTCHRAAHRMRPWPSLSDLRDVSGMESGPASDEGGSPLVPTGCPRQLSHHTLHEVL